MKITLNDKNVIITIKKEEWYKDMEKLKPYIVIDNREYHNNLILGFSTKNIPEKIALATQEKINEDYIYKLPIGMADFLPFVINEDLRDNKYKINNYPFLKPYQQTAVNEMTKHHNGILKSPTASGKTLMGIALALNKGGKFIFINDRIELCKQARNAAIKFFNLSEADCGLLQGDNEDIKKYTFTTIQKLNKVINEGFNNIELQLPEIDTLIIDECHHCVGGYNDYKTYFQVIDTLNFKYLYGITATTERIDGNDFLVKAILGNVKYEVMEKTIKIDAIVKKENINIEIDLETYNTLINKYTYKAQASKVDNYVLNNKNYIEYIKTFILNILPLHDKTIICSPRINTTKMISDFLNENNIDNFLVYGSIKKREKLYTSKIIVSTMQLVNEGLDIPDLDSMIYLGRKPHKQIETQLIGRVERYHENKKQPYVYFIQPKLIRPKKYKETIINLEDL